MPRSWPLLDEKLDEQEGAEEFSGRNAFHLAPFFEHTWCPFLFHLEVEQVYVLLVRGRGTCVQRLSPWSEGSDRAELDVPGVGHRLLFRGGLPSPQPFSRAMVTTGPMGSTWNPSHALLEDRTIFFQLTGFQGPGGRGGCGVELCVRSHRKSSTEINPHSGPPPHHYRRPP